MTGTLPPSPAEGHPMLSFPSQLRIGNAAAVLDGPHGDVTQRAHQQGLSRQALYRDTDRVLQALDGQHAAAQLQGLRDQLAELHQNLRELRGVLDNAVVVDEDCLAAFASTAQAEGVSLPVARRLLAPVLTRSNAPGSGSKRQLPSVAQLGRWSRDAAHRAEARLGGLDAFRRPPAQQAASAAIVF